MIITNDVITLEKPQKSLSDTKNYKLIRLANGLKALLIKNPKLARNCSDGSTVKNTLSAVALCIDVGSFEDPLEVQGLCHFLEHMVFMGSRKFPEENDFDHFIKSRNGTDNAMTECDYTIFYFEIDQEHLVGALDRFAQFFIDPLMLPESMEREMEAIESEFQNDISNDVYRVNQIFASMAQDCHPVANFTWGNLKTLYAGIEPEALHRIVHEFRRKYYKSNRMFLCIQSSLSLYYQQELVVKHFSDIQPEYGTIHKTISVDPFVDVFTPDFHRKMFYVKSKTKKRKLLMTFLLPSVEKNYKDRSLEYLAFLVNNEGRKSLASYLKEQSLANQITAKVGARSFEGNSMFTFFTIEVCLTRDGYDDLARVLDAIFGYLLIIKMTSIDEHKEIYEEFKEIRETLFKFGKEKSAIENVQELAVNMRYFKDADVVVGRDECPEFNALSLRKMIEKINERKFNLLILSDKFRNYDKVEKWFGTEYAEVDFPYKFTQLWNERWIRKEFSLPWKNRFICRNFDIQSESDSSLCTPEMIFQNEFCKCFFKPDDKFKLPHGFVFILFKSSMTESSVTDLNMTSIYSMCVKNYLAEKLCPATIAGYSYKLNSTEDGLLLKLNGFNEKLPMIVDIITKAMKNTDEVVNKSVFEVFKKELRKNCHNFLINSNLFNEELRLNILKPSHKFYFDRFKDVDKIDYMDFKEFLLKFLKSFKIKVLVEGNLRKVEALTITQNILKNLNQETGMMKKTNVLKASQIPVGSTYLLAKSLLPNDKNSIIKNYYQIGASTTESECLLELLVKVMREPLFNFIRTKEQLGYSVSCSNKNDDHVLGLTITVECQEKRHSSWNVDSKIESFLESFSSTLALLDEEEFALIKRSIIAQRRSPNADLESEVNRNWNEIRESTFQFDRRVIESLQLELLKKEDLAIFFNEHFSSMYKRKFSVQVVSNAGDDDLLLQHGFIHLDLITDDKHNTIKNIAQFKNSLTDLSHL